LLAHSGLLLLAGAVSLGCDARLGDGELHTDASASVDAPLPPPDGALPPDAAAPPDAAPCVEGDNQLVGDATGDCYIYVSAPTTWLEAKAACEALGAHLVVSTTGPENADFTVLAGLLDVWTGGNDVAQEAVWTWITGELMGYTNWRSGEPNNGGTSGEDCMVLEGDNAGLWDDRPCAATYGYICEREN
jgi:hypothetical protein